MSVTVGCGDNLFYKQRCNTTVFFLTNLPGFVSSSVCVNRQTIVKIVIFRLLNTTLFQPIGIYEKKNPFGF